MRAALIAEYRKFVTTRMWWVLLVTMAVYMAFIATILGVALAADPESLTAGLGGAEAGPPIPPLQAALVIYTLAPSLGYVFPVIVGALSVAGEFRHQTVTPTLLAEPRRSVVVSAKLLSSFPIGLLFGLVGVLATVLPGAGVLAIMGKDTFLTDPEVLRTAAWAVVALTLWALVGVGFGTALKNQILGIVVILAFTQLVEPILRMAFAWIDQASDTQLTEVARWLPGAAGDSVAGASFYSATGLGELLPRWQGILVLIGYGLVLALIGRFTTLRRDIT